MAYTEQNSVYTLKPKTLDSESAVKYRDGRSLLLQRAAHVADHSEGELRMGRFHPEPLVALNKRQLARFALIPKP